MERDVFLGVLTSGGLGFLPSRPVLTDHRCASNAAHPTIAANSTESTGGPKYRKLNTTPASWTTKNTQPSAPITPGADRANSARYQHRNAENNMDIVQDKPKPRYTPP